MNSIDCKTWIAQAEYAKKLRPLLPAAAFINLAILVLGWGIASYLDR